MKRLIIWTVVGILAGLICACQDITVGYLLTENASYNPDSLVIKSENSLKIGEGEEDYLRGKWGFPWVSTPIEGVEGTAQILVSIKNITSTDGDAGKMQGALSVRGDGTFEIPLHHGVPVGRYKISLNFRNEGYSKDMNDCFTIIIK